MVTTNDDAGRPPIRRLNPQALREMGPYFGAIPPENPPMATSISFWECEAKYNPLGKFGASSSGPLIRELLGQHHA